MIKGYKYRIYPNEEQRKLLCKTFGCCRFVYNQILAYRQELYKNEKKSINKTACNNYCNRSLKPQYEWLREVDKFALTNAVYHVDSAYQKFFKEHTGYPKFKSKHSGYKAYTTNFTNNNIEVDFKTNKIKLPKLKWIKAKLHRSFNGQIKSATISQVPSGKYYVSVSVETEHKPMPKTKRQTGLDLGVKDLCITSDGRKFENPKTLKKHKDKIAKLQRQLAHKKKGSSNYKKCNKRLALCHEKVANIRLDYLHKLSHKIISENQVIVTESLAVKDMMKNHKLAEEIADASWGEFVRQLDYKSEWNGRNYVKIDRFYASTQTCSDCGYKYEEIRGEDGLGVRKWICPVCGAHHDRDCNAAKNILAEGLRIIA